MNAPSDYHLFLEDKIPLADDTGFAVADCDINPQLKHHAASCRNRRGRHVVAVDRG
jgi:hypothetical protein